MGAVLKNCATGARKILKIYPVSMSSCGSNFLSVLELLEPGNSGERASTEVGATSFDRNALPPGGVFYKITPMRLPLALVAFFSFYGGLALAEDVGPRLAKHAESEGKVTKDCYLAVYDRINHVLAELGKDNLPALDGKSFGFVWRSNYDLPAWNNISAQFRPYKGYGPPGCLAALSLATIVSDDAIWSGELTEGAVLQAWWDTSDSSDVAKAKKVFENVGDGTKMEDKTFYGHAFIFLRYVRDSNNKIVAMRIADQGFRNGVDVKRSDFGYWIGANWK